MLCGILAVSPERAKEGWLKGLMGERLHLGNVMGNMEGWLGVRSVRTLEISVEKLSLTATKLVSWLQSTLTEEAESEESKIIQKVLGKVEHASLQEEDIKEGWLLKQMPNGFGPVFSILVKEEVLARKLPSKLRLFHHATSLGGVESLIEWRAMTDTTVDTRLLRISVGIESWEDLKEDLLSGFKQLAEDKEQ